MEWLAQHHIFGSVCLDQIELIVLVASRLLQVRPIEANAPHRKRGLERPAKGQSRFTGNAPPTIVRRSPSFQPCCWTNSLPAIAPAASFCHAFT